MRTLRLSKAKPGFAEYQWQECIERIIFCTKYGPKIEYYDLKDPAVNNKLIDIGFVLTVRKQMN